MSQRRRLPNSLRWRAVGWMEMGLSQADAARRLNVSRSVVQRLWDQYQSEDSVSRRPVPGRPRATTPAEDRFLALSARRRRTTTVPQLVADHFQASGRRISATTVRNRLHNAGLYARRPVVCVPLNGRQRRNRLCWAREHISWTQQQWASVLFTDESRFTMESDSGRLLIWREQRTRYHQSNTVERHSYRGGGILVWAGISLGGHTDLHVFHGGTVTGLRYRDEILDPYVCPYASAIGNDFILIDNNARPHRARIVDEYLEDHGLERMEWPARSPDLNPIEHLWDYLGREVAALNPPPRSLHELKQGLLCVWSSLPIPVSDNLINSMGNRCRQCIQVREHLINYHSVEKTDFERVVAACQYRAFVDEDGSYAERNTVNDLPLKLLPHRLAYQRVGPTSPVILFPFWNSCTPKENPVSCNGYPHMSTLRGMKIHPDKTRSYVQCKHCPDLQITPNPILECPTVATKLLKMGLAPLRDSLREILYNPDAPRIAEAVINTFDGI
ncbi:transposable element Tcb2 transposase [Trichonephila clavipes]|nr:transposable element Tcb2 transposase [Trichonephila clavipes]